MPSKPSLQAWRNTTSPGSAMWSFSCNGHATLCRSLAGSRSRARAKRALLQPEPSPLHIGAEILALRHGIVTGLVLAPAVLFRLAEAGDIALSAVGEDVIAPLVVGAHLLVRRVGVAVAMHCEAERQPRRDKRRRGRYADAETRHREPPIPPNRGAAESESRSRSHHASHCNFPLFFRGLALPCARTLLG